VVTERVTDGRRIAQLLASELRGRTDGPLERVSVVDVRDAEGTPEGSFAYGIAVDAGEGVGETESPEDAGDDRRRLADAYVHETRAHLEIRGRPEAAARAGERAGLRVRPVLGDPPRTLLFAESGVEAKRAADAVAELVAGADDPEVEPGGGTATGSAPEENR